MESDLQRQIIRQTNEILKKPREHLDSDDKKVLVSLIRNSAFFKENKPYELDQDLFFNGIQRRVEIERFKLGSVIYKINDKVPKVYYILRGFVKKYVYKDDNHLKEEIQKKAEKDEASRRTLKRKNASISVDSLSKAQKEKNLFNAIIALEPKMEQRLFKGGILVVREDSEKSIGETFGDNVFSKDFFKQDNMAVATTEVVCLTLSRKDIEDISYVEEFRIREKFAFFRDLLRTNHPEVNHLANYFKGREYMKDELIFEEGSESDYVHVVKTGDVRLIKSIISKQTNQKISDETVAHVVRGQVFGEENIFGGYIREYTAVASENGTYCYAVSTSKLNFLREHYSYFYERLKETAKNMNSWLYYKIKHLVEARNNVIVFKNANSARKKLVSENLKLLEEIEDLKIRLITGKDTFVSTFSVSDPRKSATPSKIDSRTESTGSNFRTSPRFKGPQIALDSFATPKKQRRKTQVIQVSRSNSILSPEILNSKLIAPSKPNSPKREHHPRSSSVIPSTSREPMSSSLIKESMESARLRDRFSRKSQFAVINPIVPTQISETKDASPLSSTKKTRRSNSEIGLKKIRSSVSDGVDKIVDINTLVFESKTEREPTFVKDWKTWRLKSRLPSAQQEVRNS